MYPCPCCGYLVYTEPPGSYSICPICFWEDDAVQLRLPELTGGANKVSLIEGQKNFALLGVIEERLLEHVRKPESSDQRDPEWRVLDLQKDKCENAFPLKSAWPADMTQLYYWRANYWRK